MRSSIYTINLAHEAFKLRRRVALSQRTGGVLPPSEHQGLGKRRVVVHVALDGSRTITFYPADSRDLGTF